MSKDNKNQVIKLLQDSDGDPRQRFNSALTLLNSAPHQTANIRFYNVAGYSKDRLDALLYDLQKAYDITNAEKRRISQDLRKVEKAKMEADKKEELARLEAERKKAPSGTKLVITGGKQSQAAELLEKVEQVTGKGLKIADEFPFLDEDDCPDELKVLVADKLKAFRDFCKAQEDVVKRLYRDGEEVSDEELYDISNGMLEDWKLNQQIYAELNHYKKEGKVLGEHPKVRKLYLENEVRDLSGKKLKSEIKRVSRNLGNNRDNLKNAKDEERRQEIQQRVDDYELELKVLEAENERRKKEE